MRSLDSRLVSRACHQPVVRRIICLTTRTNQLIGADRATALKRTRRKRHRKKFHGPQVSRPMSREQTRENRRSNHQRNDSLGGSMTHLTIDHLHNLRVVRLAAKRAVGWVPTHRSAHKHLPVSEGFTNPTPPPPAASPARSRSIQSRHPPQVSGH